MDGQNSVMFSKKGDEWETPQSLYDKLDSEFCFTMDGAANKDNFKHPCYCKDALNHRWGSVTYVNPPYSKIGAFVKKAYEESLLGSIVVVLIPARTDTKYFHNYCMKASKIRFISGRLKFSNRTLPSWNPEGNFKMSSAPFPSIVVVFDESKRGAFPIVESMEWK